MPVPRWRCAYRGYKPGLTGSPEKAPAAFRAPTPLLTNSRERLGVGKIERPLHAVQPNGTHARAVDHFADYRRIASQWVRPQMR